jgi:hypothetical protein
VARWVLDLTRIVLHWTQGQRSIASPQRVATIYKSHLDVPGTSFGCEFFSHCILTNSPGITPAGDVDPADQRFSWRTAAVSADGQATFPDALYPVRVTAWDSRGNRAVVEQPVRVKNAG